MGNLLRHLETLPPWEERGDGDRIRQAAIDALRDYKRKKTRLKDKLKIAGTVLAGTPLEQALEKCFDDMVKLGDVHSGSWEEWIQTPNGEAFIAWYNKQKTVVYMHEQFYNKGWKSFFRSVSSGIID
jgi:hypothetical protein